MNKIMLNRNEEFKTPLQLLEEYKEKILQNMTPLNQKEFNILYNIYDNFIINCFDKKNIL